MERQIRIALLEHLTAGVAAGLPTITCIDLIDCCRTVRIHTYWTETYQ